MISYRSTWNNRLLRDDSKTAEEILKDAIKNELLDENTHPRLRKRKEEKFYYAIKRISDSPISDTAKAKLIGYYLIMMEEC
nr:hypothetical protein [Bacillus sp. FJAT-49736]